MRSYGHVTPDWELSGITYGNGGTNDVASFKFEQREGNPPPKDVYFSSSRLRTKDHLALLEKLASLL